MSKLQRLEDYLQKHHPHIRYATPTSAEYEDLRKAYIIDNPAVPLAIVRPQSAEDAASLVRYAVSADIEINVRTGGHDPHGRCFVQDALAIDMRDIAFVRVADDKSSANIGGGVLTGDLIESLATHKLATALCTIPSVGFVGWATHGGYGPLAGCFGLGADQILGAKVVNCRGEIVEADSEMLLAIRGAGGTLGIIVELTIKTHPLDKILAGAIMFESKNLGSAVQNFELKYRELAQHDPPSNLSIQQNVVNTPMGTSFLVEFLWSSPDFEEGRRWLDRISSLGIVLFNGVKETTLPGLLKESEATVPKSGHGRILSVNIKEFTDDILQVIASEVPRMPGNPSTLFSILEFGGAAAKPNAESIFGARTPHYLLEFIATSNTADGTSEAWDWANQFRDAIESTNRDYILPTTYICLTPPEEATLDKTYYENRDTLVRIKNQYDPCNVFKHALPNIV